MVTAWRRAALALAGLLADDLGREQPSLRDRPICWEFFGNGFKGAVRQGEWKAVRDPHQPSPARPIPAAR